MRDTAILGITERARAAHATAVPDALCENAVRPGAERADVSSLVDHHVAAVTAAPSLTADNDLILLRVGRNRLVDQIINPVGCSPVSNRPCWNAPLRPTRRRRPMLCAKMPLGIRARRGDIAHVSQQHHPASNSRPRRFHPR